MSGLVFARQMPAPAVGLCAGLQVRTAAYDNQAWTHLGLHPLEEGRSLVLDDVPQLQIKSWHKCVGS